MQINLYPYEDLDDRAKSYARDAVRIVTPDEWVYGDTLKVLKDHLAVQGYPDAEIDYLFHIQGAGTSFACRSPRLDTLVHRMLKDEVPASTLDLWRQAMYLLQSSFGVVIRVVKDWEDSHSGDMHIVLADDRVDYYYLSDVERPFTSDHVYEMLDRMVVWVKEDCEELTHKIERDLLGAWNGSTQTDAVEDYIDNSNCLFTRSGKLATQEMLRDAL